jgi:hypothetical protein
MGDRDHSRSVEWEIATHSRSVEWEIAIDWSARLQPSVSARQPSVSVTWNVRSSAISTQNS